MGRIGGRGLLIGAALVAAIGVASASAIVFQGRDDAPAADTELDGAGAVEGESLESVGAGFVDRASDV